MFNGFEQEGTAYPVVSRVVLLMFCGYVITWYLQIGYRITALGEIRFEFLYAILLILISVFFKSNCIDCPKIKTECPLIINVFVFFIFVIFQVIFSQDFERSWDVFFNRFCKFSIMSLFIVSFVKSPKDLFFFVGAFLLACMKMGQEGLVGKLSGAMAWQNQGIIRLHGSTPMYTHPNSFSGMAVGTLPFIYFLMPVFKKTVKLFLFVLLCLSVNIIIYTGSRTGYVAVILLMFFLFIYSKNKKYFIYITLILMVVGFPFIPQQYISRFDTIFTGIEIEGRSIDARKQILIDSFYVFKKYPLGVGVGAFPTVRERMFDRKQDTHNIYLEIATNLGVQGFIVFFIMIFKMLSILKKIKKDILFQINKLEKKLLKIDSNDLKNIFTVNHLKDLNLIKATSESVYFFIIVRLLLGLFGMDLYEVYWWFSIGLTISLFNMNEYAKEKTNEIIKKENC